MTASPETGPDPEAADGDAGSYGPFAYLSTPNAALYRRVMRALTAEKERFAVHVRPEQVSATLAADGGDHVSSEAVADACCVRVSINRQKTRHPEGCVRRSRRGGGASAGDHWRRNNACLPRGA